VRLSHQDLAELVAVARPVVSAELKKMRDEGLVEYTRCYLCVEDLEGLSRAARG
jgi:Mn-dependent DtxR family transcriptional regulator